MGRIIFAFLVFGYVHLFAQEPKFNAKVVVKKVTKSTSYSQPNSILFKVNDSGHLANYYTILYTELKKKLKKHNIIVGSDFHFSDYTNFSKDIENAPKNTKYLDRFEWYCLLDVKFKRTPDSWYNYRSVDNRKTQHYLQLKFLSKDDQLQMIIDLEIFAFNTIATQSRKTSKIIVDYLVN